MCVIVQICGKKGSGKTFFSNLLYKHFSLKGYSIYKTSFASDLKKLLRQLGIDKYKQYKSWPDYAKFYTYMTDILKQYISYDKHDIVLKLIEKHDKLIKEAFTIFFQDNNYTVGFRLFAQIIGTDILRRTNPNIWVNRVISKIKQISNITDLVIIDDYRFQNENLKLYFENNNNLNNSCSIHIIQIKINLVNKEKVDNIFVDSIEQKINNHQSEIEVDTLDYDILINRFGTEYNVDIEKVFNDIEKQINCLTEDKYD